MMMGFPAHRVFELSDESPEGPIRVVDGATVDGFPAG